MEQRRTRFVGTYEHGLDDKGRMVLPAKIRAKLGEVGVLAKADGCLGLYTLDGFDDMADAVARLVAEGQMTKKAQRVFMADAVEVAPDQQGRIIVPPRLRAYANLGREVVTTGSEGRAEIWDARAFNDLRDEGDAELQDGFAANRI